VAPTAPDVATTSANSTAAVYRQIMVALVVALISMVLSARGLR